MAKYHLVNARGNVHRETDSDTERARLLEMGWKDVPAPRQAEKKPTVAKAAAKNNEQPAANTAAKRKEKN